jgi:hypothetical protein
MGPVSSTQTACDEIKLSIENRKKDFILEKEIEH